MATPTEKDPRIDEVIDDTLRQINPESKGRRESIAADVCATCNGWAKEFRDAVSKREYTISGMCEKCQDEAFK